MKASQLIKILQQYEEDLDVYVVNDDGNGMEPLMEVLIGAVSNEVSLLGESSL